MRLLTIRTQDADGRPSLRAGRLDGEGADDDDVTEIQHPAADGVGGLLQDPEWRRVAESANGPRHRFADLDLAPLIHRPSKIVCVGLNYKAHIREMGRELPAYPTLFAKFADTLTGPYDDVALPPEDHALDWEAELTVVIGRGGRRLSPAGAESAIAGYTIANDISMRDWQFRTNEWLQGKAWDSSTPIGPALVTPDEWTPGPMISATVNGERMQSASTSDLLFGPRDLVAYVSTMIRLRPGDVLLTGTPGGVGRAMEPPRYLHDGDVVQAEIDGLGRLRNRIVSETPAA